MYSLHSANNNDSSDIDDTEIDGYSILMSYLKSILIYPIQKCTFNVLPHLLHN